LNIDDELIKRWEKLVNKFTHTKEWDVVGIDVEPQVQKQEYYQVLMNAAKKFDNTRNTKFITYLYNAFENKRIDLYRKAKRNNDLLAFYMSEDENKDEEEQEVENIIYQKRSSDKNEIFIGDSKLSDLIPNSFSNQEKKFLELFAEGFNFKEIMTKGINVRSVRKSIKSKIDKKINSQNKKKYLSAREKLNLFLS